MKRKGIAVICMLSFVFGISSYAAGGVESIQAYLNHNFKFTLNDHDWVPQSHQGETITPVIIDGTSYLPVKSIVEATGGDVKWNKENQTIAITTNKPSYNEREINSYWIKLMKLKRNQNEG